MKRAIAINSFEIKKTADALPEWVPLVPAGNVTGRDGRKWVNSAPEKVVQHFRELGRDLPIDIEHSSEHKAPIGEPAPAVGWVNDLEVRGGEIWGRADFTAAGRELIEGRSYRYLSPVILYEPKSGIIAGLTSVAVTNQPNFRLPALNSEQGDSELPKEQGMLKALLAALGLPEDTSEADAVAKIGTMKNDLQTARNRAENPSLDRFVPRADYDAAVTKAANAEQKLAEIEKAGLEKEINTAIDAALKEGKIIPATADYYRAQCRQDGGLEQFKKFCEAAPVIAADSDLDGKKPEGGKKALNAMEKEVCENLGISEEEYLKTAA